MNGNYQPHSQNFKYIFYRDELQLFLKIQQQSQYNNGNQQPVPNQQAFVQPDQFAQYCSKAS